MQAPRQKSFVLSYGGLCFYHLSSFVFFKQFITEMANKNYTTQLVGVNFRRSL